MAVIETRRLGAICYESDAVIDFPRGLPGFEDRRQFLAVRLPGRDPLVFLQSLEDEGLCFITAPVGAVEPVYRLEVNREDLEALRLPANRKPVIGRDVLCLAVLSVRETGPTANLLAPVLVNLRNRVALQAVCVSGGYSHQHPLAAPGAPSC